MTDIEKRKSFADMKLVDFTSGFTESEVISRAAQYLQYSEAVPEELL